MHKYEGVVLDAELCRPIAGVGIKVFNIEGQLISSSQSNEEGKWNIEVVDQGEIEFKKDGFNSKVYQSQTSPPGEVIRLLEEKLIAYQEKLCYHPGEDVTTFVNSPFPYSAKLYRYGSQKELIKSFGDRDAMNQQTPDGFFVDSGLKWNPSLKYKLNENLKPGLYGLEVKNSKGEVFTAPMVISSAKLSRSKKSKILVLANTNTWTSYNIWGGRSRYRNYEDTGPSFSQHVQSRSLKKKFIETVKEVLKRLSPKLFEYLIKLRNKEVKYLDWCYFLLSLKRPYTNTGLNEGKPKQPFNNHLAAGEWRVLAWLEREGISYDYISDRELHNNSNVLDGYKGLVLSTHCEYWSKEMLRNLLDNHRNNKLWIINLSGNAIYREVEFPDKDCQKLKNPNFQKKEPLISQTLGIYYPDIQFDFRTCAPFKVVSPDSWVFEGCEVKKKSTFGNHSLNTMVFEKSNFFHMGSVLPEKPLKGEGASGWEMDKKYPGFNEKEFLLIAKGENPRGGADMILKDTGNERGGVFNASSITFGGSLLIDEKCSQIVKNVINKALGDEGN